MTNEEAKLEVIKNAYGEHWRTIKKYVTKDGWIANKYLGSSDFVLYEPFHKDGYWDKDLKKIEAEFRPVSLSGIENNNGWIRINSVDDLPKDDTKCFFIINGFPELEYLGEYKLGLFWNNNEAYVYDIITHYQPISKPKQPIY